MLADIEADVRCSGSRRCARGRSSAEGVVADVTSRDSLQARARDDRQFGKVHVVANNAGVGAGGPFGTCPQATGTG